MSARLYTRPSRDGKDTDVESAEDDCQRKNHSRRSSRSSRLAVIFPVLVFVFWFQLHTASPRQEDYVTEGQVQCDIIARGPPRHSPFDRRRTRSDRYVPGTRSILLRNATLWTGDRNGTEVLYGTDILLDEGVIRAIGKTLEAHQATEIQLEGEWVTPGVVDLHSHQGVSSSPHLAGYDDGNSLKASVQPWLRSLDGFNTHDQSFNLTIAGGVTSMLVLPGSADSIGGQAFAFKPRLTSENTPTSMQIEPPFRKIPHTNTSLGGWERVSNHWRHIKHACGENPSTIYKQTRMDDAWDFRSIYAKAALLRGKQDRWCQKPHQQTEPFPTDLSLEALVDVLRGNVKVMTHCYEATDVDAFIRLTNEFQFPVAAFHHAHEAYLVPEALRTAYGDTPALAMFALFARYKEEAYRGSKFAPKILSDAGLTIVMKSDHPEPISSRYLMFEAAQAHQYGLNVSQALGSVTTHAARVMGMDHRLGYLRAGYDADLVIWDSFPLALGATPVQVYIDGIPQVHKTFRAQKPKKAQRVTKPGSYDEEAREATQSRGDPDLRSRRQAANIVFENVEHLLGAVVTGGRVVIRNGILICSGICDIDSVEDFTSIDLKGGCLTQGLVSVGSPLGLVGIDFESSTQDGPAYDVTQQAAHILEGSLVYASDGLSFDQKNELLAYRHGVTSAIAFPSTTSLVAGVSVHFSTQSRHPLENGAILDDDSALFLQINSDDGLSTSSKIAVLRRLLTVEPASTDLGRVFSQVKTGEKAVIVVVDKADVMSALVRLKRKIAPQMKMSFLGALESWIIADDIASAGVGVIVTPARGQPLTWASRRTLPGPPLTNCTLPAYLSSRGITVAIGIDWSWKAPQTRLEAAWIHLTNPEIFDKQQALNLASSNLLELLGIPHRDDSWVAWEGDIFSMEARVRAVKGVTVNEVDLF